MDTVDEKLEDHSDQRKRKVNQEIPESPRRQVIPAVQKKNQVDEDHNTAEEGDRLEKRSQMGMVRRIDLIQDAGEQVHQQQRYLDAGDADEKDLDPSAQGLPSQNIQEKQ